MAASSTTIALARRLRAAGPLKVRKGAMPRQQQPDALRMEYFKAIQPVMRLARSCVEKVLPQILDELRDHRESMGKTDARGERRDSLDSFALLDLALRTQFALGGASTHEIGDTRVGPIVAFEIPGEPCVVVIAGQHGEERAGPKMLARYGAHLCALARSLGVGLRVYPCANPEGFDAGKRRDLAGDTHANSFEEYLVDGAWVGELAPGVVAQGRRRAHVQAPETRALCDDLARFVASRRVRGLVDLHQDSILRAGEVFAYVNSGDHGTCSRLLARAGQPLRSARLENGSWSRVLLSTDADGLVAFEDGSVTAWAADVGVPLSIAVEASLRDERASMLAHRTVVEGVLSRSASVAPMRRLDASAGQNKAQAAIDRAAHEFAQTFAPTKLHEIARGFGERTSDFQRTQLDKQLRSAIGVPFSALEKPIREGMDTFAAVNVDLIVTVPERYFDRLRLRVEDAFENADHPDDLVDEFADAYDIGENDARRIARDQLGKLAGDLNRERQESIGVSSYIWRTARDNRVRDNHFDLDGQTFSWDDPPLGGGTSDDEEGHPGEGILCRCYADPVLDDVLAALGPDQ